MIAVPAYIARRFFERLVDFSIHWYVGGTRVFWKWTLEAFRAINNHFFPTFGAGGVLGYSSALFFLAFSGLMYLVIGAVSILLYIAWIALPAYVILQIFA